MTRSLFFALALSAGVLSGTPVAASPADTVTAKVPYGDLDLSNAKGRRALDKRIERALRRVCDFNPHVRQLAIKSAAAECVAAARTKIALPQVGGSRVAAR